MERASRRPGLFRFDGQVTIWIANRQLARLGLPPFVNKRLLAHDGFFHAYLGGFFFYVFGAFSCFVCP